MPKKTFNENTDSQNAVSEKKTDGAAPQVRSSGRPPLGFVPTDPALAGRMMSGEFIGFDIDDDAPKPRARKKRILVKDYGEAALCHKAGSGLMQELMMAWPPEDARMLYAMALLLASSDETVIPDLSLPYETSFVSELYQGLDLSKEAVIAFLRKIGDDESLIRKFMSRRLQSFSDSVLIVDGMLRSADHEPEGLSQDQLMSGICPVPLCLGVMYAWSFDEDEPAALWPYPGSFLNDSKAAEFMADLLIEDAIVLLDKGFFTEVLYRDPAPHDGRAYIAPLDAGSSVAVRNNLLGGEEQIAEHCGLPVLGKKVKTKGREFLYCFRFSAASPAETAAASQLSMAQGRFSKAHFGMAAPFLSTVCFRSKFDMNLLPLYEIFEGRKDREQLINERGSFPITASWNDDSYCIAMGAELVNFLRSVIAARARNCLLKTLPEKKLSLKEAFRLLSRYKKVKTSAKAEWESAVMPEAASELAGKLGI